MRTALNKTPKAIPALALGFRDLEECLESEDAV